MIADESNDQTLDKEATSCCGHRSDNASADPASVQEDGKAIDPVCGMTVTTETAKH